MSNYTVPPPSYNATGSAPKGNNYHDDSRDPLLGGSSSSAGAFYDQPAQGDLPDDFKVWSGSLLSRSSSHVVMLSVRG